jgi:hypothetical protein
MGAWDRAKMGNLDEREHGAGIGLCVNETLPGNFSNMNAKASQ